MRFIGKTLKRKLRLSLKGMFVMTRKITIIGAGSVVTKDIPANVVAVGTPCRVLRKIDERDKQIDINKHKAEGEVMDIVQGTSFRDPISIVAGDFDDAANSDIVIITSGVARKPGQTRLELTQTNVNIIREITPQIVKAAPNALYIIVSNPVDIITYVFTKISGLPENQIIGSGTILDTSRLRFGLSEHFKIQHQPEQCARLCFR